MVHPIFSILISRPELVVDHLAGYAELVQQEATEAGTDVLKRGVAWAVTVLLFVVFLILAGTAAMLGALHGQFHWALAAAPGAALVFALIAFGIARQPLPANRFAEFKAQIDADARALRAAGAR